MSPDVLVLSGHKIRGDSLAFGRETRNTRPSQVGVMGDLLEAVDVLALSSSVRETAGPRVVE